MLHRTGVAHRDGRARAIAVLALLALTAALFAVLFAWVWRATTADLTVVAAERNGVEHLRPLSRLLVTLTDAQSAAAAGGRVDSAGIRSVVAEVDAADRAHGDQLGTNERWPELRTKVDSAVAKGATGSAALQAYGDVVVLVRDMMQDVGESTDPVLDPDLDSDHLEDIVLVRIPDVLVAASQAADIAAVAGKSDLELDAMVRVFAARHQVASSADAIATLLRKATDSTEGATLAKGLHSQLDAFLSAVDEFVSPAALRAPGQVRPQELISSTRLVRDTALPLADTVFDELRALLLSQQDGLERQRMYAGTVGVVGLLLGVGLGWLCLPDAHPRVGARGRTEDVDEGDDTDRPTPQPGPPAQTGEVTLIDPRDLLAMEEMLHVGRGIRHRHREAVGNDAS